MARDSRAGRAGRRGDRRPRGYSPPGGERGGCGASPASAQPARDWNRRNASGDANPAQARPLCQLTLRGKACRAQHYMRGSAYFFDPGTPGPCRCRTRRNQRELPAALMAEGRRCGWKVAGKVPLTRRRQSLCDLTARHRHFRLRSRIHRWTARQIRPSCRNRPIGPLQNRCDFPHKPMPTEKASAHVIGDGGFARRT